MICYVLNSATGPSESRPHALIHLISKGLKKIEEKRKNVKKKILQILFKKYSFSEFLQGNRGAHNGSRGRRRTFFFLSTFSFSNTIPSLRSE